MITELNKKAWALNGLEEPLEKEKVFSKLFKFFWLDIVNKICL
jgi:hypothetical protein